MKGVGCLNSHRTTAFHWFSLRGKSLWLRIHCEKQSIMRSLLCWCAHAIFHFCVCWSIRSWLWKEKKRKEKKRKDYAFRRRFNEKPSFIPGCPVSWLCLYCVVLILYLLGTIRQLMIMTVELRCLALWSNMCNQLQSSATSTTVCELLNTAADDVHIKLGTRALTLQVLNISTM